MPQQVADDEIARLRHDGASIQLGDVEERFQQAFDAAKCAVDVGYQFVFLARQRPVGKRGGEQPCRIQRLQQIVARCRKEPGLAQVGFFGFRFGQAQRLFDLRPLKDFLPQLGVDRRQFGGAFAHPPLEGFVCLLKLPRGEFTIGDVGIGGDETTSRHGVAADFQDRAVGEDLLAFHGQPAASVIDAQRGTPL